MPMSNRPTGAVGKISNMEKKYQPVIGMEVHVQLKTKSGMFCGCKNDPNAKEPNIYTCPVCLGLPGAIPVANKKAIEWTIKLGLMLGCKINTLSKFDRKHYFYPDLPKGYQISQYDLPFCYDGKIETSYGPVNITRIHLEEDTGKLIHDTVDGKKVSLIDFNRSGTPLVEIVTEPEIFSSAQAKEYAKKLRQIVRYLDITDADMEKGGMRLEANISLRPSGQKELPEYKVELKNINSFRFLERGIEYEIERQAEILERGNVPDQETRGYNSEKNITYTQRSKEEAADYRYFPDPDLPPINVNSKWFSDIKSTLPEPFEDRISRWVKKYGLKPEVELIFETAEESLILEKLFEDAVKSKVQVDKLANALVHKKLRLDPLKESPEKIIEEYRKTTAVDDVGDDDLKIFIDKVIIDNKEAVEDYKSGKSQAINFLVGQVLREARKKIEFARLVKLIQAAIK